MCRRLTFLSSTCIFTVIKITSDQNIWIHLLRHYLIQKNGPKLKTASLDPVESPGPADLAGLSQPNNQRMLPHQARADTWTTGQTAFNYVGLCNYMNKNVLLYSYD